jgi:hypothetical protein
MRHLDGGLSLVRIRFLGFALAEAPFASYVNLIVAERLLKRALQRLASVVQDDLQNDQRDRVKTLLPRVQHRWRKARQSRKIAEQLLRGSGIG